MTDDADFFAELLTRLPRFTSEQKVKLLGRLRIGAQVASDVDPTDDPGVGDWLLRGLVLAMRQKGIVSSASLVGIVRTKGFATYQKVRPQLVADLEALLPKRDRSQARVSLALLVGNALVRFCERRLVPTSGYVLSQTPLAMEALERAFPGYISANLFHVVLGGFNDGDDEGTARGPG